MKPKPRWLGADYASQFQDSSVAAVYRKRPPYPAQLFDILIRLLAATDSRVLDVGCGTGEISLPLAARGIAVDAVDQSAAMLDIARNSPGGDRVNWYESPAESFSYPHRYGLIICAQCLAWFDWEKTFPAFADALTSGGWLVLVEQEALEGFPWQQDLIQLISTYSTNQDFAPFHLLDGLQERALFELVGSATTTPVPFRQTIADYIDSIHGRNGFSRDRMDSQQAKDFDAAVSELLFSYHPDGFLEGNNAATVTWGEPIG